MKSRVVPGSGLTMARSLPTSRFRSELFARVGSPRITVAIPSRSSAPVRSVARSCSAPRSRPRDAPGEPAAILRGKILVGKVDIGLDGREGPEHAVDEPDMCRPSAPRSTCRAAASARSLRALIRSMTASAWLRSIRPFRNARCVNSPGPSRPAPAGEEVGEDLLRDERAAVAGDLERVLAGVGVRRGEERRDHVVHDGSAEVGIVSVGRDSGGGAEPKRPAQSHLYQHH
jgi:hypothetical protein